MTEITKLKKKYIIDIPSFELAKQDYYTSCNTINNPNFSAEKSNAAYKALCDKFDHIFRISATEANLKETAGIFSSEQKELIPRVGFTTDTTDIGFTIGLFRDFYLTTQIKNSHNIKFMKDEFWALLFELSSIGKFGFKENEKPDKNMRLKHPQLFSKTGNYYKLLRNYFLFEADYGLIRELGYISVSWENDTKFDTLIPKFCQAFKIMYQINFLLWRHDNKSVKL